MLNPGKYVAKAIGIRFVKPKDTLGFEVAFQFKNENGGNEMMYWRGWTSEKAQEHTAKALRVIEYNGDDVVVNVPEDDARFGMLANQDCINRKKEVQIVIDYEQYKTDSGEEKQALKIKWVNEIGGGQFAGASPEVVKNDLTASGFKAFFLASKQGKTSVASNDESKAFNNPFTASEPEQQKLTNEDVPF